MIEVIGQQIETGDMIATIDEDCYESLLRLAVRLGGKPEAGERLDWLPLANLLHALARLEPAELAFCLGNIVNYAEILPDNRQWVIKRFVEVANGENRG